mgnify:CR=1 FL=1
MSERPVIPEMPLRRRRTLWGDAWRRLMASPTGRLGLAIVVLFISGTVLAHFLWPYDPKTDLDYSLKPYREQDPRSLRRLMLIRPRK